MFLLDETQMVDEAFFEHIHSILMTGEEADIAVSLIDFQVMHRIVLSTLTCKLHCCEHG